MSWSSWTIDHTVIRGEIVDLNTFFDIEDLTVQNTQLDTVFIVAGKERLQDYLYSNLQPIFAQTTSILSFDQYITMAGLSYNQLDSMLDKLQNPQCLKRTLRAATICALIENAIFRFKGNYGANLEELGKHSERWEKIYKERLAEAVKLLRFDFNSDGFITDNERMATRSTSFDRT